MLSGGDERQLVHRHARFHLRELFSACGNNRENDVRDVYVLVIEPCCVFHDDDNGGGSSTSSGGFAVTTVTGK